MAFTGIAYKAIAIWRAPATHQPISNLELVKKEGWVVKKSKIFVYICRYSPKILILSKKREFYTNKIHNFDFTHCKTWQFKTESIPKRPIFDLLMFKESMILSNMGNIWKIWKRWPTAQNSFFQNKFRCHKMISSITWQLTTSSLKNSSKN